MKTVRLFLPVIALMMAVSAALAFNPPMTGNYQTAGGGCGSGTVDTPSSGECPGGAKVCRIGGEPAYSSCNFIDSNLLKYDL